jgi:hypothetical protein
VYVQCLSALLPRQTSPTGVHFESVGLVDDIDHFVLPRGGGGGGEARGSRQRSPKNIHALACMHALTGSPYGTSSMPQDLPNSPCFARLSYCEMWVPKGDLVFACFSEGRAWCCFLQCHCECLKSDSSQISTQEKSAVLLEYGVVWSNF